jgi:hypothetical protein
MNSVITFLFIFLTACTFTFGIILGNIDMKREAVKVGHAFYTNDVNGAPVWAWKTVRDYP